MKKHLYFTSRPITVHEAKILEHLDSIYCTGAHASTVNSRMMARNARARYLRLIRKITGDRFYDHYCPVNIWGLPLDKIIEGRFGYWKPLRTPMKITIHTNGGTLLSQPSQTMEQFFARQDVRKLQEKQQGHPYGSPKHRMAYMEICALALGIGAAQYLKPEDY